MAGILQALILRPHSHGNGVSRRPNLHIPTTQLRFSGHSLLPQQSLSIPLTLRASRKGSDQEGSNGSQDLGNLNPVKALNWKQPLLGFAVANFLPLALVTAVILGLANPSLGCLAHSYGLSKFSTFGIFLISGLMLRSDEIGAAVEAWPVGFFGLGSILLLTPLFSRLILKIQLVPQEFATGLAIFCCMPTTLSSGVALTRLARGNSALALAMTILSSLLGILIIPFSLSKLIAGGVGVSVPTKQLFGSLIMTLLVPLILGKVIRNFFHSVAKYVDDNCGFFSMISAVCLSLVPWTQVSRSRPLLLMVKPAVFIVAIGMGTLLHFVLLAFNSIAVRSLSVISGNSKGVFAKKENSRAVVIVASQKTLPVMVAVVEQLGGALGESGLLVLPCVAAHINQIIIDSFLANLWLQKDHVSNHHKVQ